MQKKVNIQFWGGAGSVTGSNFLLEIDGKKILIDCGLNQGTKMADDINWEPFQYAVNTVDILFVTHAHVDHLGRVPKLISEGFQGKIYSTLPTKSLAQPMIEDTAFILGHNREFDLAEIYSESNIKTSLSLWEGFPYYEKIQITDNLSFTFYNAGHILGSAMILFTYNGKNILFTGDLGNSPSPILPDTDKVEGVDYLIMESVYGDRNHESRDERKKLLESVIEDNFKQKGTLLIPTFSLERSQELLFELNDLVENRRIPIMPIFFDSPLAIKLTEIFKQYKEYFNESAKAAMVHDKYIFDFPGLHTTLKTEESKVIFKYPDPKVIIAGSGMSSGGRIVHHEKEHLPNPNNTILLTGYQSAGTLGRLIQEGVKTIRIAGEEVKVKAKVVTIMGYSGHKDSDALINFVEEMQETLKKVFVVMGEPKSSLFLAQKLKDNLGLDAETPNMGDSVTLEW
ncbi:MAG: MBL fold metallo-hydrolase [Candidatus Pacebacteria bacterium]|nr:MBL fold metallo-hydrolase [Candidatus Paceibacterota bacterium]MBP9851224.1 MBL fold metallo-hydrolase [Candidatus Paceibacterota bacterium]